ncbi:MAG: uroporphyrinogen-III C-methyltransferase [Chloroflexi bacterium]|nr:uroporphyrinogen-III C-methyltransferase [Chloroflexota bacterium]MCC6893684.1 uroporphyrinogen-III C-methyltransferase [Anaerolineae bacterium]
MTGKVVLVGAGPGDAGLITVKGLKILQQADVVLYDRLIPLALLDELRADAERIDVGKMPTKHRVAQEDINRLLIEHARQGKLVVRLKGGDPFVFGRGGEEALACHAAGIRFEVVPGVSSAIAVPAYAGVPVTHRQVASAFTVFTGHADPNTTDSDIDYAALASAARLGTLVLLMGVNNLPHIAARLQAEGIAGDTPAICIEWGTTPQQRTVEGTLATLSALVIEAGIGTPALTVIGAVVNLRGMGLDWLT